MTLAMDLSGRVALGTGGTRGIGLGITRALLAAGAEVVTCARSEVEPEPGTTHRVCDVRDPDAVSTLCRQHPGRIIVAIDARDGLVALAGWQESTRVPALALAKSAAIWGAAALLHTDIARDGMQVGPAVDATIGLQRAVPDVLVIASGGVASLADLDALRTADVRAVVLGRALYEGNFTLEEALARC